MLGLGLSLPQTSALFGGFKPSDISNLDLHYDNSAGDTCIEADFTYVSASIGTNVYYKKFGGQRWYSVGPGVPHNFDVNQ